MLKLLILAGQNLGLIFRLIDNIKMEVETRLVCPLVELRNEINKPLSRGGLG